MNWKFWKKQPKKAEYTVFNDSAFQDLHKEPIKMQEPLTLAQIRLNQKAKDVGYEKGVKAYNSHKKKINNQWVNPLQSINSGYGNAQWAYYNYQNVNYWECYALAQDPLFNKIFNILSKTPFKDGGRVVDSNFSEDNQKILNNGIIAFGLTDKLIKAIRSNFVCGGCLVYLDFGDNEKLDEPLDLSTADMKKFKGFRHIDPINITAVEVNSTEPAKADYMNPKTWYVIGLGNVHHTRFLKFEDNVPELIMRPMCMYFGMPLTLLIKQDVANSNLASQGLANIMNRFRNLYLRTPSSNFTGVGASNFRKRLETMSMLQDNFSLYPIMSDEEIIKQDTSLAGMDANCEFFYQIIASKTDITLSILLGKGAQGLSGTLEGERENFYDRIRSIQESLKPNLLKALGIIYGYFTDGKFHKFEEYMFNPLMQANEKEKAENLRTYTEAAQALIEIGIKTEDVVEWLQSYREFHLENVTLDDTTPDLTDYDDAFNKSSNNVIDGEGHEHDSKGLFTEKGKDSGKAKKDVASTQKRSKIRRRRKVINLPEKEFAQIQSAFITDVTNEEREQEILTINFGNYKYKGLLREDGTRDIIGKRRIKNV